MKISNTRLVILLSAIALASVGFLILVTANQNMARGSYISPIPSPGYEDRFLAYTDIAIIGGIITGLGTLLGLISIGVRRWPRYKLEEFYINGIRTIGISVASTDYEKDRSVIQSVMRDTEMMVHARNEFSIGEPEFRMGWNFFVLHVTPDLVNRVADHLGIQQISQSVKVKVEDRFVSWLEEKLKERDCNVYLDLESRKGTSKYGLF